MITQNRGTIAFAVCGSFCTLEAALQSARALTAQGWQLLPVMSFAARQDTRFGTGNYWKEQLEAAAGHPVLDTQRFYQKGWKSLYHHLGRCVNDLHKFAATERPNLAHPAEDMVL